MRRVGVFCGTALGVRAAYAEAAQALAYALLHRGMGVVYGGHRNGLMQVLAETMLAGGGEVVGVVLTRMQANGYVANGLTTIHQAAHTTARKEVFANLADGFIALPGGYGTFDELLSMVAAAQVGELEKPCGVLNVAGYFDPLLTLRDQAIAEGFLNPRHRDLILVDEDPDALLERFLQFTPSALSPWNAPPAHR
jgi:uncharacterized protein (TIGR00730 family)